MDIITYLKKGALVAQHPESYEHLEELDHSDIEVLRMETTKRWHHPVTLYALIALNSVGAGKSYIALNPLRRGELTALAQQQSRAGTRRDQTAQTYPFHRILASPTLEHNAKPSGPVREIPGLSGQSTPPHI